MTQDIVIYGAGGFAREVAWLAENCSIEEEAVVTRCFIDDFIGGQGKMLNDIPILTLDAAREQFPMAKMIVSLGKPKDRERLVEKSRDKGFEYASLIHPRTERSRWITVGKGTVICAGNILTTNIIIKDHVHLNLDCTIGHDCIIEDLVTLAPGVHVSGRVHIKKCVYIGTGAVIINGEVDRPLRIGEGSVIGAGACIIKDVEPYSTVVGVPGKRVK